MANFPWGAAIGGVSSLAGNIVGNINANKQIKAAKEEAEKTRQFNANEAKKQRDYEKEFWEANNAYNTPQAQMQRLKDGGLNADLMYGNGSASTGISSSSPKGSAASSGAVADTSGYANRPTYGNVAANAMALEQANASIKKTEADTSGQEQTNKILTADALLRAAQNEQNIELSKSTVYLNHQLANYSHKQLEQLGASINNLNAQTSEVYAKIDNIKAQTVNTDIDTVQKQFDMALQSKQFNLAVKRLTQDIRESNSRINLNANQIKDILATQGARIMNLKYQGALTKEQTVTEVYKQLGIDVTVKGAQFNLDQSHSYDDAERTTRIATQWISSLGSLIP